MVNLRPSREKIIWELDLLVQIYSCKFPSCEDIMLGSCFCMILPRITCGLEKFVKKFLEDLPCTDDRISLLGEVSDDDASSESGIHYEHKDLDKQWHSPWGSTVVDDVAPAFKTIVEENYLSSSTFPLDDTKENRLQWWTQRKKLDHHRLGKLLRLSTYHAFYMLGTWKIYGWVLRYLLLGNVWTVKPGFDT
ncbi:hypothetical protein AAG906_032093 [Vitis piasezkii]